MESQELEKPAAGRPKRRRIQLRSLLVGVIILAAIAGSLYLGRHWSVVGASLANPLRSLIGNQGVANLETILFNLQDQYKQWQYSWGRKEAAAPWQVGATPSPPAPTLSPTAAPAATAAVTPRATSTALQPAAEAATRVPPAPTLSPTPANWLPDNVAPLGSLEGEGIWTPYIVDSSGRTLAARTFLQPDPARPYAYVAVVAFDLSAVRLNFVIGFDDPSEVKGPKGEGIIDPADYQPGVLLAAFNGGFFSAHGGYGAMQDGFVPLPPQDGIATVAMYQDGSVRMGKWGDEITLSGDMVAYRQNCPIIVNNGEINERVYTGSTVEWGGTIDNEIVTWRSGLGLSQDDQTLYYFAGPSLSMPSLADAMLQAGAYQSMLLDINAFWVHFVAIQHVNGAFTSAPLLPDAMKDNINRFLSPFPRDFFYITTR